MKRFKLLREKDESGVSGTGIVAEGVEFANGKCALTWLSRFACVAFYDNIKALEQIHGHHGATVIVWIDAKEEET